MAPKKLHFLPPYLALVAAFFISVQGFYEEIRKEEFKIPDEEGGSDPTHTFFNPDREGWLRKEGGSV